MGKRWEKDCIRWSWWSSKDFRREEQIHSKPDGRYYIFAWVNWVDQSAYYFKNWRNLSSLSWDQVVWWGNWEITQRNWGIESNHCWFRKLDRD